MMTKRELAQKVRKIVAKWIERINLDKQWKIKIHIAPYLKDTDNDYVSTQVISDPQYFSAEILFSPEHYVKDHEITCLHESLHILLSPLNHFIKTIINTDEKWTEDQIKIFDLWLKEEENIVERLADAFLTAYSPKVQKTRLKNS